MNIQIFGTQQGPETRKAERWFKERSIKFQLVDLAEKAMSLGEMRSVAPRVGGFEALIDRAGKRYESRGLKMRAPSNSGIERALFEDPLLLRTPIVRNGQQATVGFHPEVWETWK